MAVAGCTSTYVVMYGYILELYGIKVINIPSFNVNVIIKLVLISLLYGRSY